MNSKHFICRTLLAMARDEAQTYRVKIPRRITALRSTSGQFFIEPEGMPGQFIKACCPFEARAKFISALVDEKKRTL